MSIIVEFDGIQHYQNILTVIGDPERDAYFASLEYKVIRLPYYIQLSKRNIKHLFGVDMDEEMCTLKYSFFDSPNNDCGLGIALGSMCGLGIERFVKEFMTYPAETKNEIVADLRRVADPRPVADVRPLEWVVPKPYQDIILKQWS